MGKLKQGKTNTKKNKKVLKGYNLPSSQQKTKTKLNRKKIKNKVSLKLFEQNFWNKIKLGGKEKKRTTWKCFLKNELETSNNGGKWKPLKGL